MGDAVVGTIAGGSGDDTVTYNATALGGSIFGDGIDTSAAGVGTGADVLGSTAAVLGTAGVSVYGGGGSDTIQFGAVSGNSFLSGQNGATSSVTRYWSYHDRPHFEWWSW